MSLWVDDSHCNPMCLTVHGDKPPITVVRRFVHLLDIGDIDYNEEIGEFYSYLTMLRRSHKKYSLLGVEIG